MLPECMQPDGGNACDGYRNLYDQFRDLMKENTLLKSETGKLKSAVEHGEYLADTSEKFMRDLNDAAIDGGGYKSTDEISDNWGRMASHIYEFRKRANNQAA